MQKNTTSNVAELRTPATQLIYLFGPHSISLRGTVAGKWEHIQRKKATTEARIPNKHNRDTLRVITKCISGQTLTPSWV